MRTMLERNISCRKNAALSLRCCTIDGISRGVSVSAAATSRMLAQQRKAFASKAKYAINTTMNIQFRVILTIVSLAVAFAICFPSSVRADELKEAKVTQIIQDVRVLPSGAAARPAALNDDVRQGTAVRTGIQSRSELTFKDQTITRLGEKTIYSPGAGVRTIDVGSGQFLLYLPKNSGGAKVKMGPVTAAITG
jgi:hypothetical protein